MEEKNGVRRASLPYPWNEISYHLIKYISCEGRYNVVYGYHFKLLEELRFGADPPPQHRLIIPYFLLQSMIDMGMKVQKGNHQQLAHHGLITLIIEDALQHLRIPITWETFRDKQIEGDIEALEYDKSPTTSEEDEEETEKEEEEKERDEEELYEEEEEEKEKESGEEIEGDGKEEIDEQSEELEGEEEEKEKDEKRNGKEEAEDKEESPRMSPEATEREATTALTAHSTPIKQKGKRQRQNPLYFRTRKITRIR